jgi:hypothetical protein
MNRKIVVIYGNCQAQFLWKLLSEMPSLQERFQFLLLTNTVEHGEALAPIHPEVACAAILWEQYDQRSEIGLRDEALRRVPDDCMVVRYPAVGMNAFWPFRVKDKRSFPEPKYPWGRYPQGDRVALEVAKLGLTGPRAFECYMRLSSEEMPDVRHLLSWDRAVHTRRDAACDLGMGDFVFANLRHTYQFWTHGHLAISVLSELLLRLWECSRAVLGGVDDKLRMELQALQALFPGQGEMQLPLHPLVIEKLDFAFVDAGTRYRWFDNHWTFAEYMQRYLAFDLTW